MRPGARVGGGRRVTAARIISTADPALAREAPAPVDVVLRTDLAAPARARRLVREVDDCCLPPSRMNDVLVAVSEAVTNAVLHAYPEAAEGPVRIKAWSQDNALAVLVLDEGRGFDPDEVVRGARTGLGLGLDLMRRLASETSIVAHPGAGAAVLLIFRP